MPTDCQPTEGGAGPSPAPPAVPSPRLPPQAAQVAGSPLLNTSFNSSSSSISSGIRSSSGGQSNSQAPSSCPSPSSVGHHPQLSYVGPSFFGSSSAGPRPPSVDGHRPINEDAQRHGKSPSPFQQQQRPTYANSVAPPPLSTPILSTVSAPAGSLAPPPPVFTSSSFPFYPPVSMIRTPPVPNHHGGALTSANSFLAPSPPTTAPLPSSSHNKQGYLGSVPGLIGEPPLSRPQHLALTSLAAPASGPGKASTETSPSSSSRPVSRSSSTLNSSSGDAPRSGSLPFLKFSTSTPRGSPSSLPPPLSTPSAFPTPGNHHGFSTFLYHTMFRLDNRIIIKYL